MKFEQLIRVGLCTKIAGIRRLRDATDFASENFKRNALEDQVYQLTEAAGVTRYTVDQAIASTEEPNQAVELILAEMRRMEAA